MQQLHIQSQSKTIDCVNDQKVLVTRTKFIIRKLLVYRPETGCDWDISQPSEFTGNSLVDVYTIKYGNEFGQDLTCYVKIFFF